MCHQFHNNKPGTNIIYIRLQFSIRKVWVGSHIYATFPLQCICQIILFIFKLGRPFLSCSMWSNSLCAFVLKLLGHISITSFQYSVFFLSNLFSVFLSMDKYIAIPMFIWWHTFTNQCEILLSNKMISDGRVKWCKTIFILSMNPSTNTHWYASCII